MNYSTRVTLVVLAGLPGALLFGFGGFILFAFAADGANRTWFTLICQLVVFGFGLGCLGASPGLILGLVLRVKWVLPFLGATAGCLLAAAVEELGLHNASELMTAGYVVFGSFVGSVVLWFWPGNSLRATLSTPTDTASPIHSAATLYIRRGSKIRGPFERVAIRGLFTAKKLKKSDEVASTSDGPWELLGDVYKTFFTSP